jgi:hypothetical protein
MQSANTWSLFPPVTSYQQLGTSIDGVTVSGGLPAYHPPPPVYQQAFLTVTVASNVIATGLTLFAIGPDQHEWEQPTLEITAPGTPTPPGGPGPGSCG